MPIESFQITMSVEHQGPRDAPVNPSNLVRASPIYLSDYVKKKRWSPNRRVDRLEQIERLEEIERPEFATRLEEINSDATRTMILSIHRCICADVLQMLDRNLIRVITEFGKYEYVHGQRQAIAECAAAARYYLWRCHPDGLILDGKSSRADHLLNCSITGIDWVLRVICARGDPDVIEAVVEEFEARSRASAGLTRIDTILNHMSKQGYLPIVQFIVSSGKAQPGPQPLFEAIAGKRVEVTTYLIEKGADPRSQWGYFSDALSAAAYHGYMELVNLLLCYDVSGEQHRYNYEDALIHAAREGRLAIMKRLLEFAGDLISITGRTDALQAAVHYNHGNNRTCFDVMKLLIAHGADVKPLLSIKKFWAELGERGSVTWLEMLLKEYGPDIEEVYLRAAFVRAALVHSERSYFLIKLCSWLKDRYREQGRDPDIVTKDLRDLMDWQYR